MIRNVSFVLAAALLGSFVSAGAQQTPPPTFLDKQLARMDLGISGAGLFTPTVSGPVNPKGVAPVGDDFLTVNASNTVGVLVNLRYVVKPYVGAEFNYTYARYTENFSYPPPTLGVQTQSNEYSVGYLVTPPHTFLGLQPFASAGVGTMEFKPTPHGGQSLDKQARMVYYYSVGLQTDISPHFGVRAAFRQAFFLAPDFGQNYFTINQHTSTYEPTAGFYLRF